MKQAKIKSIVFALAYLAFISFACSIDNHEDRWVDTKLEGNYRFSNYIVGNKRLVLFDASDNELLITNNLSFEQSTLIKRTLPQDFFINQVCVNSIIRLVGVEGVFNFNEILDTWEFRSYEEFGIPRGCIVSRNRTYIYSDSGLLDLHEDMYSAFPIPDNSQARFLVGNLEGDLFLLVGGDILYEFDFEMQDWLEIARIKANIPQYIRALHLVSQNEVLWLSIDDKVVKVDVGNGSSMSTEEVLTISNGERIQRILENKSGEIWIITSQKIWRYDHEKLSQLSFPFYSAPNFLFDGALVTDASEIIVSTDLGVFTYYFGD